MLCHSLTKSKTNMLSAGNIFSPFYTTADHVCSIDRSAISKKLLHRVESACLLCAVLILLSCYPRFTIIMSVCFNFSSFVLFHLFLKIRRHFTHIHTCPILFSFSTVRKTFCAFNCWTTLLFEVQFFSICCGW